MIMRVPRPIRATTGRLVAHRVVAHRVAALRVAALAVLVSMVPVVAPVAVSPAAAALSPVVTVIVDGRGNGHGIGVSQWGAYGWSTQHNKTWQEILAFYYGGTTLGSAADADFNGTPVGRMTVQLVALDGAQTAVVNDGGLLSTTVDAEARTWATLVAREVAGASNRYAVWGHLDRTCPSSSNALTEADGWTLLTPSVSGPVEFTTPNGDDPGATVPGDLIGVCEPSGPVRYYRGTIRAVNTGTGLDRTVSDVAIESYVKAVVPRESSASWADAAGGKGMHSLKVQAVAARSYALAGSPRSTVYKTCDTTSCQVYGGAAVRSGGIGSSSKTLEDPRTNTAVDQTAGVVVRMASGKVANTMFSSSNGGRSVSGGMYPAVDDAGDAVEANPHHTWSVTLAASKVMSAWPSIGNLLDIVVTQRSGGGPWNGWIDKMQLKGSKANVTISGDDFRRAFGLKTRYLNFTLVRASTGAKVGPGLLIGDSVGSSVKTDLTRLLADSYAVTYNARSSRCTIPRSGTCNSNNAMPVIAGAEPVPSFVVMQVGYNDVASKFGATIDAAMQAITARGTTRVVWINLSERRPDGKGGSAYAPANAALRAATGRWPQLVILDWNAASSGDEASSWFVKGTTSKPDYVHLTSVGRTRFALFVRTQLDELNAQGMLPNGSPNPGDPNTPQRPTLQRGSVGPYVVDLQQALTSKGYNLLADGDFGAKTESAVIAFQTASSLIPDGIVGPGTWLALGFTDVVVTTSTTTTSTTTTTTTSPPTTTTKPVKRPTLRRGSKGPFVVELQQALVARGYDLSVDGMFGSRTLKAVKAFQKSAKVPATGIVASRTWKALGF